MTNELVPGGRIWVVLDESRRSAAALSAAAALAAELDAELAGLFVEDIELQHWSRLPFAREFSLLSGAVRTLSQADVERVWRREAEALQRQLAEAAGPLRLRWSFRVARGKALLEVNTQAQALDLVVLGKRLGIRATGLARATAAEVFPSLRPGPVLVRFEDAVHASRSLELGATLARRTGSDLLLLVGGANEDAYRAACQEAQAALRRRGLTGRCLWLGALDHAPLTRAVRQAGAGCLVLSDRDRVLLGEGFERVVDETECPIVLAR